MSLSISHSAKVRAWWLLGISSIRSIQMRYSQIVSRSIATACCWWAFNDKLGEDGRVAEAPLSQSRTGNREKASTVRLIQATGLRWQRARQVTRQVRDHYLEADSRSAPNCRFHAKVINWGFKGSCFTSAVLSVRLVYLCKAKPSAVICYVCVICIYTYVLLHVE